MKSVIFVTSMLFVSSAFAADAPPTVTLTQPELSAIINAEASKAVANFAAQQEVTKAKDAYAKINEAFASKPAPKQETKP